MSTATAILAQLDDAVKHGESIGPQSKYDDLSDLKGVAISEATSRLLAVIHRLSPLGSPHRISADSVMKQYTIGNGYAHGLLLGIAKALRADYAAGYLLTVEELVHADVFADFMDMGDHLLGQGYKDPAAVVVGSVLEEHLRKLCLRSGIAVLVGTASKKADLLNSELAGANVYSKLDLKSVTAWLDLRNKAAHGHYTQYTKEQVQLMVEGVRNFMSRFPA
jgi:hypothetical protein